MKCYSCQKSCGGEHWNEKANNVIHYYCPTCAWCEAAPDIYLKCDGCFIRIQEKSMITALFDSGATSVVRDNLPEEFTRTLI